MMCRLWEKRQNNQQIRFQKCYKQRSEINQSVMKLSSIKQDFVLSKQSVRISDLHKVAMTGIVDTLANIQVSGGQES